MTVTYELEIAWPITDPDAPLGDLKAQAHGDLTATLATRGLHRAGNPLFAVTHGARPAVTARLLVTGPAGMAGPIHASQVQAQGEAA